MNKIQILLILLFTNISSGQDKSCDCLNSLEEVSKKIKVAKSYKSQIKTKSDEFRFEEWKSQIIKEINEDSLKDYFCLGYLQKYISFIKDNHNIIYQKTEADLFKPLFYEREVDDVIDSDSISGIYYSGNETIKLIKHSNSSWLGVMDTSDSDIWKNGAIRLKLNKNSKGKFEIFEHYKNGLLVYNNNIEIKNNRIGNTFWNKDNTYHFYKQHEENFGFKSLDSNHDYINIKSLKRTYELMDEADTFYNDLKQKLVKPYLIIDLRNNGGGSLLQTKSLIRLLRKTKEIKRIYVLINFLTASAAEISTLRLKDDKRTVIVGENSKGAVSYGYGNEGIAGRLNCNSIQYAFSIEVIKNDYLKYEQVGITPDVLLNNDKDWIKKIIELNVND